MKCDICKKDLEGNKAVCSLCHMVWLKMSEGTNLELITWAIKDIKEEIEKIKEILKHRNI